MEPLKPKTSRLRAGWELAKSAWNVLRLDKELSMLPLFSALFGMVALALIGILYLLVGGFVFHYTDPVNLGSGGEVFSFSTSQVPGWVNLLFGLGVYFSVTCIANFFGGAVIYGAMERFRGGDPTIKSSLAGARRKFRPLLLFSLMMASIGFALQTLEERVPFAGRIALWLVGAAWNIANFFAIPVIMMSDEDVHPFDATRRSVGTIKKVWGESVIANVGIGLVFLVAVLAYLTGFGLIAGVSGVIVATLHASAWLLAPAIILGILGLVALMLVFTTLDSIVRAALYHYATTGQAPERFNQELLRTAITPKKARKIFS